MEVPEKIFICDYGSELGYEWHSESEIEATPNDIEYIRTDVFIEKAISYIQQHWIWNTKMIENFKKYMEE